MTRWAPLPGLPAVDCEAMWLALLDSVPYFVALADPDGRVRFLNWNQAALPAGFLEGPVFDLSPRGGTELQDVVAEVAAGKGTRQLEIDMLRGDELRWLRLTVAGIRDPGKSDPVAILLVGHDITESRRAGVELRMSVNALHRLVEAREQLAADLHDGILQSLYGIGLRLEAARAALDDRPALDEHLDRAVGQVRESMAEVRQFIREERNSGGMHWEDTLTGLVRGLEVDGGPGLTIHLPRAVAAAVPNALCNDLVFIAREAVSNAMRHSGAARVTVRLTAEESGIRLEIEDDGRGLPTRETTDGFGLLNMTRRASQIGAVLTLQTGAGTGTLVRLDLPANGGAT